MGPEEVNTKTLLAIPVLDSFTNENKQQVLWRKLVHIYDLPEIHHTLHILYNKLQTSNLSHKNIHISQMCKIKV